MIFDLLTFDQLFDDQLEEIINIIDNYLNRLIKIKPDAVLRVEIEEDKNKKIWKGYFEEPKELGKEDVVYGRIEIIPLFIDCGFPLQVKLFCSEPKYLTYWSGLENTLLKNLNLSDGSPPLTKKPWDLIPDHADDQTIVKLWHKGYKAEEIGYRIGKARQTVYNRLGELRKKHGVKIIPYGKTVKNLKKPHIFHKK